MRITERQLRRIIREEMRSSRSALLREGVKEKLVDAVQFLLAGAVEYGIDVPTLGAGAPIGSAAETIIDAAFGAQSVSSAIQAVNSATSAAGKFKDIFNSAMKAKGMIATDLEGFYEEIKKIVKKGLELLGAGAKENLKEIAKELQETVQKLVSTVADSVGDAVKFLIPDATIGTAAGEAVQALLEQLTKNCFQLIGSALKSAGKFGRFIVDPKAFPEFLEDAIPKVVKFVEDGAAALDNTSTLKALISGGTAGVIIKQLGPAGLRKVAETIKEKAPSIVKLARQVTEILIPVTFTLLAMAQILYNEEFLSKEEDQGTETKAESNESYKRVKMLRINESQLRRIIQEARGFGRDAMLGLPPRMYSQPSSAEDVGIVNPNGTRSSLGNLLAKIAMAGRAGLEVDRKQVEPLIYARYVVYGLHPLGGYRANITGEGRDALANI